jgi:hypothetical protein
LQQATTLKHALLAKVGTVKDECEACNNLTF